MRVVKLFSNRNYSYGFCLILTKLGTHDLCANTQKTTVGTVFKILILNFLLIFFLNFKFGLNRWNSLN